jgi:protein SCO1/2
MNKKALYGLIIALVVPLVAFLFMNVLPKAAIPKPLYLDSVHSVVKNGKNVNDSFWHHIPDFTLTNQLGQKVSLSDVSLNDSGRIVVANFFFTHCPNICPGMTMTMKRLQSGIKKAVDVGDRSPDFLQFISFSIDPERDSVQALKKWADRFQIDPVNWWLLTGDKKTIYDLSNHEMKLSVQDPKVDSVFPHTDIFILIDKYGVIRARRDKDGNPLMYHSNDSTDMADLAEDIVLLSLEKDPKRKSFLNGQLPIIAIAMLTALVGVVIFLYVFRKRPDNS